MSASRGAASRVPARLYAASAADAEGSTLAAAGPRRSSEVRTAERLESVPVRGVTPNLFALLGVPPAVGRAFGAVGVAADEASVVLSYGVWQRLFDARADVIGQTLWIDGTAHVVAAVMPPRFWFA